MTLLLLTVGVVLVVSALCSLFEAALYSVPVSHIESMAQAGRRSGRILKRLREQIDGPITAILTLNTVANTGGAAIAGALAAGQIASDAGQIVFSAVFTVAILIFSEVVPKTIGVVYGRSLVAAIALPLDILVRAFFPVIWFCRVLTRLVARKQTAHRVSGEEIIMLARLGLRSGSIDDHEAQVIQNVLSLEDKTAHDVMTPRTVVYSLRASRTVEDVRHDKGLLVHSRIPVYDKDADDIVGLVHSHDILAALADDKPQTRLEDVMHPVHFVLESLALDRLLLMFLERRQHLFVVLDEFGGLSGVVSLEDVLEEILGKEIVDEFDRVPDMRELAHTRRQQAIEGSARLLAARGAGAAGGSET